MSPTTTTDRPASTTAISAAYEPPGLCNPPPRTPRPIAAAAVTALLTVLIGVGTWLFSPSDMGELAPPPNIASYPFLDGVVSEVDLPKVVLESYEAIEGDTTIEFSVPEENLRYFDVVHLRAHSSIGLPTRIYYERDGNTFRAVYKEDAPANSRGGE